MNNNKVDIYTIVDTSLGRYDLDINKIDYEATNMYSAYSQYAVELYQIVEGKRITLEIKLFNSFDDTMEYYNELLKDILQEVLNHG